LSRSEHGELAVTRGQVQPVQGATLYATGGDWLVLAIVLMSLLSAFVLRRFVGH